jgi:hypothetical protein
LGAKSGRPGAKSSWHFRCYSREQSAELVSDWF